MRIIAEELKKNPMIDLNELNKHLNNHGESLSLYEWIFILESSNSFLR